MILEITFWLSGFLLFYSYVIYPLLLQILAIGKKTNDIIYIKHEDLPSVSILIAAYNEEKVIAEKFDSIFNSDYPLHKIEVLTGSDGSIDRTNEIIQTYKKQYPDQVIAKIFKKRKGKSNVINALASLANNSVFILTDANVIFNSATLYELVKHFKNKKIALVGANVINKGLNTKGISIPETRYIQRENLIKYREGTIWSIVMGAFGACYAIRKDHFPQLPSTYLMEDYYVTMHVLNKGKQAIYELQAMCIEDVSSNITEEFRRKIRISTGNFQNLSSFYSLLWPPFKGLAFSFFSHKILRWFGPFLILLLYCSNAYLWNQNQFYHIVFICQSVFFLVPLLDFILKRIGINIVLLRFITYFIAMNFALLIGFIKYIKGVKTSVWEPTKRNQ